MGRDFGAQRAGARRGRLPPLAQATGGRLTLHLLVEDVLGLRLDQSVPVGYGLDMFGDN